MGRRSPGLERGRGGRRVTVRGWLTADVGGMRTSPCLHALHHVAVQHWLMPQVFHAL